MDIYKHKSSWKWLLAVMGFIILCLSMLYSKYLADNLAERELATGKVIEAAISSNANTASEDASANEIDRTLALTIFENFSNVPIIVENEEAVLTGYNYEGPQTINNDQAFLKSKKATFIKSGKKPIQSVGYANKIYLENSTLYRRISLFPLVQILLLGTFILFGYYLFSTSRKAEQNRVWAGMAKETAHQLGTPISAIIGWIEHLKETDQNEMQTEIVSELRNDVTRLELIADRFSKIGSKPDLTKINLIEELNRCKDYMQRRAPKRVIFDYPALGSKDVFVNINSHLFDWVVENILRNALDSMEGKGQISATVKKEGKYATINLSDTGKGIPANKFKQIFEPGYTTKKRGWGLGLSLAKRIIEEYHSGKIFVKNSKLNEGTTFTIQLPLA